MAEEKEVEERVEVVTVVAREAGGAAVREVAKVEETAEAEMEVAVRVEEMVGVMGGD